MELRKSVSVCYEVMHVPVGDEKQNDGEHSSHCGSVTEVSGLGILGRRRSWKEEAEYRQACKLLEAGLDRVELCV